MYSPLSAATLKPVPVGMDAILFSVEKGEANVSRSERTGGACV